MGLVWTQDSYRCQLASLAGSGRTETPPGLRSGRTGSAPFQISALQNFWFLFLKVRLVFNWV